MFHPGMNTAPLEFFSQPQQVPVPVPQVEYPAEENGGEYGEEEEEEEEVSGCSKKNNTLKLWGNERTMNLNPLILTNIQSSHYFKVNLYDLKTYHEVIDEIYYKVGHLEPWEKGSRKTSGQTGMCGGVRGVGAGGIVSTAYCLLYKLFTIKLTQKQLNGLINHSDSAYIRALGFMYIRYTQAPADLWAWYDDYLEDEEELDVKAGSGQVMTIGEMLRHFLSKLEWFSTLFPRIPVPIQQGIEKKLSERFPEQFTNRMIRQSGNPNNKTNRTRAPTPPPPIKPTTSTTNEPVSFGEAEKAARAQRALEERQKSRDHRTDQRREHNRDHHRTHRDFSEDLAREKERQRADYGSRERSSEARGEHRHRRHHEKEPRRHKSRSRSRDRSRR